MAQAATGSATAFISYARQDAKFVTRLAADLRKNGVAIWLDQDLEPSQDWPTAIQQALTTCPQFVVVLSRASVASSNVLDEVNFARDTGKRIVPLLLEQCEVPFRIRTVQYVDFTGPYDEAFDRLLRFWTKPAGETPVAIPRSRKSVAVVAGIALLVALAAGAWWFGLRSSPSDNSGAGGKAIEKPLQQVDSPPPVVTKKKEERPKSVPPPRDKAGKVAGGTDPTITVRPAENNVPKQTEPAPGIVERPSIPEPKVQPPQQPPAVTGCENPSAAPTAQELINIIGCMLKKPAQPILDQVVRQSITFCQAGPGIAHQTQEQKTSGFRACLTRLSLAQLTQVERNLRSVYEP